MIAAGETKTNQSERYEMKEVRCALCLYCCSFEHNLLPSVVAAHSCHTETPIINV